MFDIHFSMCYNHLYRKRDDILSKLETKYKLSNIVTRFEKKFYKASNDSMFKAIFTTNKNKDLLEEIIWEAINIKVNIKTFLVQEQVKNNIHVRGKILDLIAKTDKKEINIEVNNREFDELNRRNAAFIFKRYSDNVAVSKSYNDMPDFIQINLTKDPTLKLPLVSCYKLYDKENNSEYIDNLLIYEINISKAKEMCYNKNNHMKLISILDCNEDELNSITGDEFVERVKSEINRLNQDKEFIEFLSEEDEERLYTNTIKENSFKNGVEHGIDIGISQGIISTAKKMLKKKFSKREISEVTGLSIDEIDNLKDIA